MEFEINLMAKTLQLNDEMFYAIIDKNKTFKCIKNTTCSVEFRKMGNDLFVKKKHNTKEHQNIWQFYSKAIAAALNNSEELAIGYANRSAFLEHLKKYEECLVDINRALTITASKSLKIKLLCRKSKCNFFLEDNPQTSLKKAKYWLNKIDDPKINKNPLIKMIKNTESILENTDDDEPNYKRKKKYKTQSIVNAFTVSYKGKYGRCLIASRDIKPGECIHMDKFYITNVKDTKTFAYCNHCLSTSWTNIPCLNCSIAMYCSENCRDIAWKKYHNVECLSNVAAIFPKEFHILIALKSLVMGINEAGSINNLKRLINNIDKSKGEKTMDVKENEILDNFSFKHIYSLQHAKYELFSLDAATKLLLIVTIALLETKCFEKIYKQKFDINCNTLRNEKIIFIAALLLRLVLIFQRNASLVLDYHRCQNLKHPFYCNCLRGMSISPFSSLINHSCNNNVDRIIRQDGKIIYVSINSIKKDSQLFSNYYLNYLEGSKFDRQDYLSKICEINCECKPCKENWRIFAEALDDTINIKNFSQPLTMSIKAARIFEKNLKFMESVLTFEHYSKKSADEFLKDVEFLLENTAESSYECYIIVLALKDLLSKKYGSTVRIPKCKD